MKKKDIKKMSKKELDEYIEELPYIWMKALRVDFIKKIKPNYSYYHNKRK